MCLSHLQLAALAALRDAYQGHDVALAMHRSGPDEGPPRRGRAVIRNENAPRVPPSRRCLHSRKCRPSATARHPWTLAFLLRETRSHVPSAIAWPLQLRTTSSRRSSRPAPPSRAGWTSTRRCRRSSRPPRASRARRTARSGCSGRDHRISRFITTGLSDEERELLGSPPTGRGILGVLIDEARPLRLRNLSDDPRSVGFPPNHPPMRSFLGVPVAGSRRCLRQSLPDRGAGGAFTDEDERIVLLLAGMAAVAIENARLYVTPPTRPSRRGGPRGTRRAHGGRGRGAARARPDARRCGWSPRGRAAPEGAARRGRRTGRVRRA